MNNKYNGNYVSSWVKVLLYEIFIRGSWGVTPNDSLTILNDKLVLVKDGKEIELTKSQINNIRNYWFMPAVRINHTNSLLPELLFFQAKWRMPLTVAQKLREAGYLVK